MTARHAPDLDRFIELSARLSAGGSLREQREAYSGSSAALGLRCPEGIAFMDGAVRHGDHLVATRRYQPDDGPHGLMVYFHGGGWVKGDLASHHEVLAHLAVGTGVAVLAVDYPLAPEVRHPVQLECCHAVLQQAAAEVASGAGGETPLLVAGDSAGGQLAAALCLLCRDRGGPSIDGQILIYPALSHRCDADSFRRFSSGPLLTAEGMRAYWRAFLPVGAQPTALVSPLLEEDLSRLPPALIQLAEVDVLHDEGLAYAERLTDAGVPAEVLPGAGMVHGFLRAIGGSGAAMSTFGALCGRTAALIARLRGPQPQAGGNMGR